VWQADYVFSGWSINLSLDKRLRITHRKAARFSKQLTSWLSYSFPYSPPNEEHGTNYLDHASC